MRRAQLAILVATLAIAPTPAAAQLPADQPPDFSRHISAIFGRLGCNGGSCHGAVQGKNGFRLSLFAAQAEFDHRQVVRDQAGRRIDRVSPGESLLLAKATGQVAHGGGKPMRTDSPEYRAVRDWLAAGAQLGDIPKSQLQSLEISPRERTAKLGESYTLSVTAQFADGASEDVTWLCAFQTLDAATATVDQQGKVTAVGVGDVAILARYRDAPATARAMVSRSAPADFSYAIANNFIDTHILDKLARLNVPPSAVCDDATFLRRARLDITGQLPEPDEVRAFLADADPNKRAKKIDQLLCDPGHADLWALKFCDLLKASDFGVYADGLFEYHEAPRFQAWVRARLAENLPYDEFAARILTATSREGRSLETWADEVIALQSGYASPRTDVEVYNRRQTLDIYWQRRDAVGVPGAIQIAHAFLGLRLECAQCHRHPHDVWQQDDLLSFANFFTRVRRVGFEGDNEKRYPEDAVLFKKFEAEGKRLTEEAKKLREGKVKQLSESAKQAQQNRDRLKNEIRQAEDQASQAEREAKSFREQADKLAAANQAAEKQAAEKPDEIAKLRQQADERDAKAKERRESAAAKQSEIPPLEAAIAEHETAKREADDMDRRGKLLGDEVAKRILHAQVFHRTDKDAANIFASVTSPLGTQSSKEFRLLGEQQPLDIPASEDPRTRVADWLRRPDNPYFAKAIVNRVWAHYFGRGLVDPPDDLSPFNAASHPELLAELCRQFVAENYNLKWLHRTIALSRTYQQSTQATPENAADRSNYAYFYVRRLPAEVMVDALNQATGTVEQMGMKYYHWPEGLRAVEIPYVPQNEFVAFMLEQFGRSPRNSSVQCDCQRQDDASMLQVLALANHPRVWQKITEPSGRVGQIARQHKDDPAKQVEELYLAVVGRMPSEAEALACLTHVTTAESAEKGLQSVLWSLLNTKEFLLQH